jgi:hypothetical protein
MFEAALEEGFGQDGSSMNLSDLRLQLGRYRSRWDHFDPATQETIVIPPVRTRICEKGYLAYAFDNHLNGALCVRCIRFPSTRNGVTRGEWTFDLELSSSDVAALRMTLQPELDLLFIFVSSDGYM